jgi:hypothetical protein
MGELKLQDGAMASAQKRADAYLVQARQAEDLAEKASFGEMRESWLKIAQGYRQLAKVTQSL